MGKIHRLPPHIADQIAAGEVVERPASVVRELLENAIDAGADSIDVEIIDGGKRLIRVTDNGCGMDRRDLELAVERHATSKISSEDDLAAIRTLGFRGEAMPSIASVARFAVTSTVKGEDSGWRVTVDFGKDKRVEPAGSPAGTVVEVEDLFLKIPARLRFLKRRQTEAGHISQQIRLHAAANPHIRFSLTSDGRQVLRTSGRDDYPQALWPLLGHDLVEKLLPVRGDGPGIKVYGHVAPPDEGRSSSRAFYFFLNGRSIGNRLLWKALNEAAKGFFMSRTYPAGVIFMEVDPADVDVNVHPAKQEVRFHHTDAVYRAIYHSTRRAWENKPHRPGAEAHWKPARSDEEYEKPASHAENVPLPWETSLPGMKEDTVSEAHGSGSIPAASSDTLGNSAVSGLPESVSTPATHSCGQAEDSETLADAGQLQVIGQLDNSYILAEGPEGLVIVDQHAAHEGLIFRRLLEQFRCRGQVASQPLMFPDVVDVRPEDAERLDEILPTLAKLGIKAERFGPSQLSIRTIPDFLAGSRRASQALRDILDRLFDAPALNTQGLIHELLASMACHSAIRANQRLEHSEMCSLLSQLSEENVHNCPHGRPVYQLIGFSQIRRNFKRT